MTKTMEPIHPGEVLYEDFLIPLGVTQHHLAVFDRSAAATDQRDRSRQAPYHR